MSERAEATIIAFDPYIIRHLDAWLNEEVHGDTVRDAVRSAMLEFIADDVEYWGSQSWWNVFDHAKCMRIVESLCR